MKGFNQKGRNWQWPIYLKSEEEGERLRIPDWRNRYRTRARSDPRWASTRAGRNRLWEHRQGKAGLRKAWRVSGRTAAWWWRPPATTAAPPGTATRWTSWVSGCRIGSTGSTFCPSSFSGTPTGKTSLETDPWTWPHLIIVPHIKTNNFTQTHRHRL